MEMEDVKERIDSPFLLEMLKRIKLTAIKDPVVSSGMLMHVSRLLRYQLYETMKEKTLLTGEIQFIQTYLTLEQQYDKNFHFCISVRGETQRILVTPLLFFPFVKEAVRCRRDKNGHDPVKLSFVVEKKSYAYPVIILPEIKYLM